MFMHVLNTVFIFAALVVLFVLSLYHFECTTTFDRPLFWEVCPMHSVSVIMYVLAGNLALIFLYCYCCLIYRILSLIFFNSFVATLGLLGYIYLELPLPSTQ